MVEIKVIEMLQGSFRPGEQEDHAWVVIEHSSGNAMHFRVDVDTRGNFKLPYMQVADKDNQPLVNYRITPE